jgi:hypothetical protein
MSGVAGQLNRAEFDRLPADAEACARSAFVITPEGFSLAAESARDNHYMATSTVDVYRALSQHRLLQRRLGERLPVVAFPGDPATPDAVFPNNVFATAQVDGEGRLLIGRMRHPVRQREADRRDLPCFFGRSLGYRIIDLRDQPGLTELTGTLVIDRARGVGFAGLSPRCDAEGAATMAAAFGLRCCIQFPLSTGEYHTNVVLSVLASRAMVICPDGFAEAQTVGALAALYAPAVIELDKTEKDGFAGNCIALDPEAVWMSERAADSLRPASLAGFERAGFRVCSVPLDEIEKAGGSLRCCVAEIF